MPTATAMFFPSDADSGPQPAGVADAGSEGVLLKRAMARLAAASASVHADAHAAAALPEMPAKERASEPAPILPTPNERAARPPRARYSPEMQASLIQLLETNARINRFIRFCNRAIAEIHDTPDTRDRSKKRSQPCAS